jgi:hypothetical protein
MKAAMMGRGARGYLRDRISYGKIFRARMADFCFLAWLGKPFFRIEWTPTRRAARGLWHGRLSLAGGGGVELLTHVFLIVFLHLSMKFSMV